MKENQIIYNPKLAKELLRNGHVIVNIEENKNSYERTVFFFKNSPELQEQIYKYKIRQ